VMLKDFPYTLSMKDLYAPQLSKLRCGASGKLITAIGTVLRVSDKKVVLKERLMRCTKCGADVPEYSDIMYDYQKQYMQCINSKCKGRGLSSFKEVTGTQKWKDIQDIRIRQRNAQSGTVPVVVSVVLEHDLVGTVRPGDDVAIICYPLMRFQKPPQEDCVCAAELILLARGVHVVPKHPECDPGASVGPKCFTAYGQRNEFVENLFPDLAGLFVVKLALALMLVGGERSELGGGVALRGESHILLQGAAATGKTRLLQRCLELSGRGVFATGTASSLAGLTATAVMEHGEWHLEAGALVLSDSGVCCIDEFSSLRESERMSLLEAMEQQSVSIAKAGIVTRLPTRCNVVAACTTSDKQFSLPLLSRFDLIFELQDYSDKLWDGFFTETVWSHTMTANRSKKKSFATSQLQTTDSIQYLNLVKKNCHPKEIPPEAQEVIERHYHRMRAAHAHSQYPVTTRALEALIRLTQAHRRLMGCDHEGQCLITTDDAVMAVWIMEHTKYKTNLLTTLLNSPIQTHHTHFDEENFRAVRDVVLAEEVVHTMRGDSPPGEDPFPRESSNSSHFASHFPSVVAPSRAIFEQQYREPASPVSPASSFYEACVLPDTTPRGKPAIGDMGKALAKMSFQPFATSAQKEERREALQTMGHIRCGKRPAERREE